MKRPGQSINFHAFSSVFSSMTWLKLSLILVLAMASMVFQQRIHYGHWSHSADACQFVIAALVGRELDQEFANCGGRSSTR